MSVLSRKYRLKDPNFISTETNTETETLVSERLPDTYGEKNEIFDQVLPGTDSVTNPHPVENGQAQKLHLGMVEHPAETGNGTRHLRTGSEMKIHQTLVASASTPIQSGDIFESFRRKYL